MQANDYFLNRTFFRYLFPTILSVLGGTVNVTVDSIIIGNVLGEEGLAAITLSTPVYMILCTIGSLIASGAAMLVSHALGKNDSAKSRYYYTEATFILLAAGVISMLTGLLFADKISALLGASGEVLLLVEDYLRITLLGGAAKILLYIPFYFLRLDGRANRVTVCLLVMTSINIVLDLLFMTVWNMGMKGAALASVLATVVSAVLGFAFLMQKKSGFHFVRLCGRELNFLRISVMGSPTALFNLLSALRIIALNSILLYGGGKMYVSVFAVLSSVGEFTLCIINGVPQTASPLIGVYSSEKDNRSVRVLMKQQLFAGLIMTSLLCLAMLVMRDWIFGLFGFGSVGKFAQTGMLCFIASLMVSFLNSILSYYFNTVGRVRLANTITICRIFAFAVLPAFFLHGNGIWFFYPISELGTLVVIVIAVLVTSARRKNLSRFLLLDDELEKSGKEISFSVGNDIAQVVEASEKISDFCDSNDFSSKQTMAVSLSIEEMLTVILSNCFEPNDNHTVDIRIFKLQDGIVMRLRNAGREFNPVKFYEDNADNQEMMGELMGIKMITKLAQRVVYQRTFGMNSLLIII